MEHFKLKKPDLSKIDGAKAINKALTFAKSEGGYSLAYKLSEPNYLFWDKVKYHPLPKNFTSLEAWFAVREIRRLSSRPTAVTAEDGTSFAFLKLACSDELLHRIDIETGGRMFAPYQMLSEQHKQKFLTRGIIEEAIASSQIEGASTTRKVAKKMILENREPRTHSERMIINNYKTMQMIEQDWTKKKMSLELLFEMHKTLTDQDSKIPENERGRLRKDEDKIVVYDKATQQIVHVPPKGKFLKEEIHKLISYANNERAGTFVHPIIKAIFLHFWIGYLHPFTDGNGRMARALFYWYLLKEGYWIMMYLPISTVIKKSQKQYSMAYIYAEQDDYDITYFYDYHLRKIIQSLDEFHEYMNEKISENKAVDSLISQNANVNDRQKQTLYYLLSDSKDAYTTTKSYMAIYNVSRLTAYNDLKKLVALKYLEPRKAGKTQNYYLTDAIRQQLD